jgi:hypothetical protein
MAVDVSLIVGQENMQLARKQQVISILHNLDQPAPTKRYLFARWARLVGVEPDPKDIDQVAPYSG